MKLVSKKEFKINNYISLRLIGRETVIFIKGQRFDQCKFLLFEIPMKDIKEYDEIQSIDELEINYSRQSEGKHILDPETEFWGHCSNIQAWTENNYDTRLLHRTISFPLLKKLTDVGDPTARRIFKEEIYKRFESGNSVVILYLLKENYLKFLNNEENTLILSDILNLLDKLIDFSEYLRSFIQIVKEKKFNFNKIVEVVDYKSMELIEYIIQLDRAFIDKFFMKEFPNFQKDDKIILLTCILLDLIHFFDYLSDEEFCVYFGDLGAKSVANKLGFEFEQTYQDYDIFKDHGIKINNKTFLKLGTFGIEIILELIRYDFRCEEKYELIGRIMWKLKKFDNTHRKHIDSKILSFFKTYESIIPLLAQQGYLDILNEEELEIFTQNLSRVIKFEDFYDSALNISLIRIVKTRLKKLNLLNRKNNFEAIKKSIWKIIRKGNYYDLRLVLINFLEEIKLPKFLDFLNENLGLKKYPFRKFVKGYINKHNFEKFLEAFELIFVRSETSDERDKFFKIFDFFINLFQFLPPNLKKKTRTFFLTKFPQGYDWRIDEKLNSSKIIINEKDINDVDVNSFRKLI